MIEAARRGKTIGVPSAERLARVSEAFASEYGALTRFAYFVTGDPERAQDLVQDAYLRVARSSADPGDERFGAYVRTTIVNLSRSGFRRRTLERRATASMPANEPPDPGPRDEMWRAILRLSPRQRAVIALRFYEDLSEREVATTLGMSVGSVKTQSHRAIARLREILGRDA